jgi:ParB-like chromosome segregation protein Spo0J
VAPKLAYLSHRSEIPHVKTRGDELPATANWRELIKVHPAANAFPMLSPDELDALTEDIKANGVQVPIITWFDRDEREWLIDGRNRLDALAKAGYRFDRVSMKAGEVVSTTQLKILLPERGDQRITPHHYRECETGGTLGLPIADPYTLAAMYNLHRRHLSVEDRKHIAAALLKANPERSNRSVAAEVKLDDKTVAHVRKGGEARSEIPHVETRSDSKGRAQPAEKPKKSTKPSEAIVHKLARLLRHQIPRPQDALDGVFAWYCQLKPATRQAFLQRLQEFETRQAKEAAK